MNKQEAKLKHKLARREKYKYKGPRRFRYPPLPQTWQGEFLEQVKQEIAKLDLEHERYVQAQICLPRLIKKAEIQERK